MSSLLYRSAANAWCGRLAHLPQRQAGVLPARWEKLGELTTGLSAGTARRTGFALLTRGIAFNQGGER